MRVERRVYKMHFLCADIYLATILIFLLRLRGSSR